MRERRMTTGPVAISYDLDVAMRPNASINAPPETAARAPDSHAEVARAAPLRADSVRLPHRHPMPSGTSVGVAAMVYNYKVC